MISLTTYTPAELVARIYALAEARGREPDEQTLALLQEILEDQYPKFSEALNSFYKKFGPSQINRTDLDGLRSNEIGRPAAFL